MMGQLKWRDEKNTVAAILDDDGVWQSNDKRLAQLLNFHFSPKDGQYSSPAAGYPGALAIHDAAEALKMNAEVVPHEPGPEGVIY